MSKDTHAAHLQTDGMGIDSLATAAGYAQFLFLENIVNMLLLARKSEKERETERDPNSWGPE